MICGKKTANLNCSLQRRRKRIEYNRRSAIIDKAALPKCKSIACSGCKHVVVRYTTWGGWYVLGCGKDNPCKDYEPTDITPEKAEAIREALNIQWQYN